MSGAETPKEEVAEKTTSEKAAEAAKAVQEKAAQGLAAAQSSAEAAFGSAKRALGLGEYENVDGKPQWSKGLCSCFSSCAGIKSFFAAFCWPFFGCCLFGKVSARVGGVSTIPADKLEKIGDTPFKIYFRMTLFLVLLYWFAAWGESMMAPDAHFKPLDSSAAEFKDFEVMNNYTENALDAVAKTEANITFGGGALASDLENLDKNITDDMKKEAVSVATTVHEDASVLWPGKNEDLDDLERIADFPEIAQSLPPEAVSPAQQFFAVIKWLVGVVWVLLVILLRANARKRFDIDARCCNLKVYKDINVEDIVCSVFCAPCVLAQIATHTEAVSNENGCDLLDASDPGESEHCVVAMDYEAPEQTNSMQDNRDSSPKERGAMV